MTKMETTSHKENSWVAVDKRFLLGVLERTLKDMKFFDISHNEQKENYSFTTQTTSPPSLTLSPSSTPSPLLSSPPTNVHCHSQPSSTPYSQPSENTYFSSFNSMNNIKTTISHDDSTNISIEKRVNNNESKDDSTAKTTPTETNVTASKAHKPQLYDSLAYLLQDETPPIYKNSPINNLILQNNIQSHGKSENFNNKDNSNKNYSDIGKYEFPSDRREKILGNKTIDERKNGNIWHKTEEENEQEVSYKSNCITKKDFVSIESILNRDCKRQPNPHNLYSHSFIHPLYDFLYYYFPNITHACIRPCIHPTFLYQNLWLSLLRNSLQKFNNSRNIDDNLFLYCKNLNNKFCDNSFIGNNYINEQIQFKDDLHNYYYHKRFGNVFDPKIMEKLKNSKKNLKIKKNSKKTKKETKIDERKKRLNKKKFKIEVNQQVSSSTDVHSKNISCEGEKDNCKPNYKSRNSTEGNLQNNKTHENTPYNASNDHIFNVVLDKNETLLYDEVNESFEIFNKREDDKHIKMKGNVMEGLSVSSILKYGKNQKRDETLEIKNENLLKKTNMSDAFNIKNEPPMEVDVGDDVKNQPANQYSDGKIDKSGKGKIKNELFEKWISVEKRLVLGLVDEVVDQLYIVDGGHNFPLKA